MKENAWKRTKLYPRLRALNDCYWFTKEAKSIRGIPDIVGSINGKFFALECKKSKNAKRTRLQEYTIQKIKDDKGYATFVYPENLDRVINELESLAKS